MRNIILTSAMGLFLAGCATTQEWQRPKTSAAQREQDTKECQYDADKTTTGLPAFEAGWDGAALFRQCMDVRGYKLTPLKKAHKAEGVGDVKVSRLSL